VPGTHVLVVDDPSPLDVESSPLSVVIVPLDSVPVVELDVLGAVVDVEVVASSVSVAIAPPPSPPPR
jgi:hypothetical protein